MHADEAIRTPQFWLLWAALCLTVMAGIGVLGQASPMIQELVPGALTARSAAGFVVLLGVADVLGRFIWSSASDAIGRRSTYAIFFALGAALYTLAPRSGQMGNVVMFVAFCCAIMSIHGGGFATIPAYVRDQFGAMHVGAIHGRLLTAWSLAGVAGPVLVNYIREYQVAHGVAKADAYSMTMYLMAGLLVIGFVANWLIRPVHPKHHFTPDRDVARD